MSHRRKNNNKFDNVYSDFLKLNNNCCPFKFKTPVVIRMYIPFQPHIALKKTKTNHRWRASYISNGIEPLVQNSSPKAQDLKVCG